jgi:hypothetical protein
VCNVHVSSLLLPPLLLLLLFSHFNARMAGCTVQGAQGRGGRGEEEVRALNRKGFSLFRCINVPWQSATLLLPLLPLLPLLLLLNKLQPAIIFLWPHLATSHKHSFHYHNHHTSTERNPAHSRFHNSSPVVLPLLLFPTSPTASSSSSSLLSLTHSAPPAPTPASSS